MTTNGPGAAAGRAAGVAACLLVAAAIGAAAWLQQAHPDAYYRSVQEDEWLEWASFWAFALASGAFLLAARAARGSGWRAWWPLGLALFCAFVALEEISWGQRVLGYRPPEYFLQHNFQQELNLHNVVASSHRKLALQAVIVGYGVLLPLLGSMAWSGDRLRQLGVAPPIAGLAPGFAAVAVLYRTYPWDFTGEWVEMVLGLLFLFAAVAVVGRGAAAARVGLACALALALGVASAAATRWQRAGRPDVVAAARAEVEALGRDFDAGLARSRCGRHKRLYTFVEQYRQPRLHEGEFASMTGQGLPAERARYFLDPWNSPYWIRHSCPDGGEPVAFVYSFGPDRMRDSTRRELRGDDVGAYLSSP